MLRDRLLTASVLITIIVVSVYFDWQGNGLGLLPLLLFFAGGTAWEMGSLMRAARVPIRRRLALAGVLVCILGSAVPMFWEVCSSSTYPENCPVGRAGWIGVSFGAALGMLFLFELSRFGRSAWPRQRGATVAALGGTAFVVGYVGIAMGCLFLIRTARPGAAGIVALVGLIVVTKCGDIGAYAVGKMLGKRRLIPRISPGKTREGLLGGILLAIVAAYGWFWGWNGRDSSQGWWGPAVFGLVIATFGVLGDLAESLVKRDVDEKDSGHLLPGMGGVWDVTDSPIGTAIPGYLLFASGIVM
jgi:phosphatidate cytidylyltransferase